MVAIEALGQTSSSGGEAEYDEFLDLADDEGWEDLEPDMETATIRCLFCDLMAEEPKSLISHCRDAHGFDIVQLQKDLGLDFLGMIKLINYVRSETAAGNGLPDPLTRAIFQDDQYLKPVLEDDALLYNLHDVIGEDLEDQRVDDAGRVAAKSGEEPTHCDYRIQELEQKLQRAQQEIETLKKQVEGMKLHFNDPPDSPSAEENINHKDPETSGYAMAVKNNDSSYFAAYSGHEIHETMLKDRVRTDAYRDFIYDNKGLLHGKTVLDVGCGTGILSMFCARAGAARVIAVDNSDIIDFARENVYRNGMGETISCLRGKIEEVTLPVETVDIIVSEWMGYCLLYEAMLDSVIWARDHYLKADGLMIPSHCALHIAPLTDADYIDDYIHHWKDVYGFDMISMHRNIYNDVLVKEVQDFSLPADSAQFLKLNLKNATTEELTFENRHFAFELRTDIENLDGFVVWFDTFFLTSSDGQMSADLKVEDCKVDGEEFVAFTTGPYGKRTHWQQGVLLIDHRGRKPKAFKKGQKIQGTVGYRKRYEDSRALDIDVHWHVGEGLEVGRQSWSMR